MVLVQLNGNYLMGEQKYVTINLRPDFVEDDTWEPLKIDGRSVRFLQGSLLDGFHGRMKSSDEHGLHWFIQFFSYTEFSVNVEIIFSDKKPNERSMLFNVIWQKAKSDRLSVEEVELASQWIRESKTLDADCYNCISSYWVAVDGSGLSMISKAHQYNSFERVVLLTCLCISYRCILEKFISKLSHVNVSDYNELSKLFMDVNIFNLKWYFRFPVLLKNNEVPFLWDYLSGRFKINEHYDEVGDQLRSIHALVSQMHRDEEANKWNVITSKLSIYLVFLTFVLVIMTGLAIL